MKKRVSAIVVSLALSSPLVWAASQGSKAAEQGMGPQMMQQGGGMAQMPMMRQMQAMHDQMSRIHETEDPEERQELLMKHMQSMQGMMQMMHGMMGIMGGQGGMMSQRGMGGRAPGLMHGGGTMNAPGAGGTTDTRESIHERMDMLQERLDAMQTLMDQMMQNQREMLKSMPGMGAM